MGIFQNLYKKSFYKFSGCGFKRRLKTDFCPGVIKLLEINIHR